MKTLYNLRLKKYKRFIHFFFYWSLQFLKGFNSNFYSVSYSSQSSQNNVSRNSCISWPKDFLEKSSMDSLPNCSMGFFRYYSWDLVENFQSFLLKLPQWFLRARILPEVSPSFQKVFSQEILKNISKNCFW